MNSRNPPASPATNHHGTAVLEPSDGLNPLGVPLDRHREWYHYHHLFRDLLGAEHGRREPELIQQLHARAAAWCEVNGLPELASTMPRPPGTPTGPPGWSKASRSPPTPADAPRPPAGGSSGSKSRGLSSGIR